MRKSTNLSTNKKINKELTKNYKQFKNQVDEIIRKNKRIEHEDLVVELRTRTKLGFPIIRESLKHYLLECKKKCEVLQVQNTKSEERSP